MICPTIAHICIVNKVSRSNFLKIFFKSFWRTHVLFWGHWYPCFGFLVMSHLGFKARVGSALFAIFAEANVMYIPQDSPLVLHLPTFWRPARSRSLPHSRSNFDRIVITIEKITKMAAILKL